MIVGRSDFNHVCQVPRMSLKAIYTALIRLNLDYERPIWAYASKTELKGLNKVQAKIISVIVSSPDNLIAELECGLPTLKQRRKYLINKLTIKANNQVTENISKRTFGN